MDDATLTFSRLRPRLHGIAYRMLGTVADAEELVQDAWLRWHEADRASIASAQAWLVTVVTRMAIDRLRAARLQRAHYPGIWLPEPLFEAAADSPEQALERAGDVSIAFLRLLERLTPEARAAFLLREVFDVDYADAAQIIGKSEAACRQLVSRAREQLRDERPRYEIPEATHRHLLQRFAAAITGGDFAALRLLLADSAELLGDGGGKVGSFPEPLRGGQRIAQLFWAAHLRHGAGVRLELACFNGRWGMLRYLDGALESAIAVETDGERVLRLHVQRNPDKLARVAARPA